MKILNKHWLKQRIVCKGALVVHWLKGNVLKCVQQVALKQNHVIDFAMIVQLDSTEATKLGLVNAIGVIQGEKSV